jgi:hypothetical protein
MQPHNALADRFVEIIGRAGGRCSTSRAGTGSIYVTVEPAADQDAARPIAIRFADHGECYCGEAISVDPDGCTLAQAVRAAARVTGLDLSRSLRAFAAAETRAARVAAAERERTARRRAEGAAAEAARRAAQAEWIASRYPDYAARSIKSQKKIRAAANRDAAARS